MALWLHSKFRYTCSRKSIKFWKRCENLHREQNCALLPPFQLSETGNFTVDRDSPEHRNLSLKLPVTELSSWKKECQPFLILPQVPVAEVKFEVSAAKGWGLPSSVQRPFMRWSSTLGMSLPRIPGPPPPLPNLVSRSGHTEANKEMWAAVC